MSHNYRLEIFVYSKISIVSSLHYFEYNLLLKISPSISKNSSLQEKKNVNLNRKHDSYMLSSNFDFCLRSLELRSMS